MMNHHSNPREVWLRGPLEGIIPELQPVAHALLQVREELECVLTLSAEQLWKQPGGVASVGFHVKHLAGSTDRLLTYARGEQLIDRQRRTLEEEKIAGTPATPGELIDLFHQVADNAISQLRLTTVDEVHQPREVGRARLPSTTWGILFHAAEHARRHAGQVVTTTRIVLALHGITVIPGQT